MCSTRPHSRTCPSLGHVMSTTTGGPPSLMPPGSSPIPAFCSLVPQDARKKPAHSQRRIFLYGVVIRLVGNEVSKCPHSKNGRPRQYLSLGHSSCRWPTRTDRRRAPTSA